MQIFLIIPATSEYYPDIAANDNKKNFQAYFLGIIQARLISIF